MRFPNHGGLTPAALGCVFASPRTLLNSHRTAFAFPNHGGLTTPLSVVVLLVAEQRSILTARVRFCVPRRADARRSCRTCVCAPRMSLFFNGPTSCTRSGWRKPAVVVKRFARAKGNRMFATIRMRPSRAAPGAAGVSQPWGTIRSCVVNVITPRKPIAVAGAVSEPRRADARRSCRTCVCAPRMSLFFRRPASCTKSCWRKPAVGYRPIVRGELNHSTKTDRHCRCGYRTTPG